MICTQIIPSKCKSIHSFQLYLEHPPPFTSLDESLQDFSLKKISLKRLPKMKESKCLLHKTCRWQWRGTQKQEIFMNNYLLTLFYVIELEGKWKWELFCHVWLFATPWTVARLAPLFMEFSRQEHWSGLLCCPLGNLPNPRIKSDSLT